MKLALEEMWIDADAMESYIALGNHDAIARLVKRTRSLGRVLVMRQRRIDERIDANTPLPVVQCDGHRLHARAQ